LHAMQALSQLSYTPVLLFSLDRGASWRSHHNSSETAIIASFSAP
jgi:hypothetical protein